MNQLFTLIVLVGMIVSLNVYEVTKSAVADTAQQAQVYSSLQGAVQAFLGLGSSVPAQNTSSYSSTTSSTQNYNSFGGSDATFGGTEAQYAQYNGFPDANYNGTFGDDTESLRQTGAGIQTSTTSTIQQITNTVGGTNTVHTNTPNALTIQGTNPVLSCIPGTIAAGEPAMVLYACGDTSTSATGDGFDTAGATSGKARVYPTDDQTLEISCDEGTNTQCLIQVIHPSVAIIATPSSTVRNGSVDLTWKGEDVNDCVVRSNKHSSFSRRGVTGDAPSPSLIETTRFTLLCETETGTIVSDTVDVTVN